MTSESCIKDVKSHVRLKSVYHFNPDLPWKGASRSLKHEKLIYVEAGKLDLALKRDRIELLSGNVMLIGKGERVRTCSSPDAVSFFELEFDCDIHEDAFHIYLPDDKNTFEHLLHFVSREFSKCGESNKCDTLMGALLAMLTEHEHTNDAELVRDAIDLVEKLVAQKPSAKTIAEALNTDESRLCKVFVEVRGVTLGAYINSRVIANATAYLTSSAFDIGEISRLTGFDSSNAFTKFFTYHMGLSPSNFRRRTFDVKVREKKR